MKRRSVYLDSSSILKRYVEEPGSEIVDTLYEVAEANGVHLYFSVWNIGEVLGGLDKYKQRRLLAGSQFREALQNFLGETSKLTRLGELSLIPVTSSIIAEACQTVLSLHLYVADALQLSSSTMQGCEFFLSADHTLVEAAKIKGMNAFEVESQGEEFKEKIAL